VLAAVVAQAVARQQQVGQQVAAAVILVRFQAP